ncbi:MAG: CorA family divalent cation transporter [Paludibacteraceae bacterium]
MSKVINNFENFQWIDLHRPDKKELGEISRKFDLNKNSLVDSLEHGHLPKIEKVNDYTFIILRAYLQEQVKNAVNITELTSKIAFFVNDKYLITIHNREFSFLNNPGTHASSSSLMLGIIERMLDTYRKPLDTQAEKMDDFEYNIFLNKGRAVSIETLYYEKSKAHLIKKVMGLTQDVLFKLQVKPELNSNLQDIRDSTIDFMLQSEEIVDDGMTLLNVYLSMSSERNNQIMKLLTVFSAFFLPLTFIVGLYGMNFRYMPELELRYGYFITLAVMLIISVIIFIWFKRKKIM